uniref:Uncharacterized protein n=1 Tax=Arundo donax TaxID=35708 RepID=A0A0A9DSF1_ARUDO
MRGSDEFKPFVRRLPEFKFWSDLSSPPSDLSPLTRSICLLLSPTICYTNPLLCYTCIYLLTGMG